MRLHDLGAFLNPLPVHAQGLPIGIEGDLEIKGMGSWTVIFQVLQPLCALCPGGSLVIGYPPGDECRPITFDKPIVAFAQDLGVEPIVGEGVD